jgi:ferredoxin
MSRKDGKSVLLGATDKRGNWVLKINEADAEANRRAAEACPVKIIDVRD